MPVSPDLSDRVIVVSVMKAGTHLIQELMVALGYGIYGQSRVTPEIRPKFDERTRWRVAEQVYPPDELANLRGLGPDAFAKATDEAWDALAWSWQIKFGMPLENRYGREVIDADLVRAAARRTVGADFADTPAGVAWVITEFDLPKLDGHFLREWVETGEPKIIFNYRDPRDVVLSMVNFLSGRTSKGFGNFSEFAVVNQILASKPTLSEQLDYALSDPSFPGYAAFEKAYWLLNHPNVCKVTFEELVGARGGGSDEAQRQAVDRVTQFLGADPAKVELKNDLFNSDAFSFFKGQIGSWRGEFSAEQEKKLKDRLGDMLVGYGYE